MDEIVGDLWQEHDRGAVVAITTNGTFNKDGMAVMLNGCALQARQRYTMLPKTLGTLIRHFGNHVFDLGHRIVNFPVEDDPYQVPDLRLIEQSCRELVELVDYKGWQKIVVPRPGCGGGGLEWSVVKKILQRHLDARFHIITNRE